jgi:uncharacterized protein YecE (DUF72 family)
MRYRQKNRAVLAIRINGIIRRYNNCNFSAVSEKGSIHIGTSGWVYPHWKDVFYPSGLPQRRWLEFYSQQFDCTEINASFYRLPTQATVEKWQATVGRNFRFCPKISRFITHAKKLNDPEQAVPRFFDVFGAIARSTGPVLIQLPAALAFNEQKTANFFGYLQQHYKDFRCSLEARHGSWMENAPQTLMKKYHIGWVIAESGDRFASAELVPSKHIYLRFHGPDGHYATSYSKSSLRSYAKRCLLWKEQGHTIWVFFNNDLHGYAVQNARTFQELLR